MYYNALLVLTGNDIGPQSLSLMLTGIFLFIGGAFMNANIFGTISNVYQQVNMKEATLQVMLDQANYYMYELNLDNRL